MPEMYGRKVCAEELLLRNTIVRNFASGWENDPAYHIPTTAGGHVGAGMQPVILETDTKTDTQLPLEENTQSETGEETGAIFEEPTHVTDVEETTT